LCGYLDLDHFKAVNDTLGHPVGDALLREVTERLGQQVREVDTVARLGGDEFAIIQSKVDQPGGATALAKRLVEAVSQPYDFDGNQFIIGASIGIAIVPGDGQDPDELMKNADMALYRAKGDGRGRWRFFEPEMDALMQARRSLEMDIRRALAADEFELYYQPLMAIETRTVSGFEALLRWHHPERGMVPPSEFVPLAEEIGVIIPLGKWVLNRACADAATWPGGAKVAVNVSGVQFSCHTLVDDVAAALAASGLAPNRLELEITETVLITDTEAVLTVLRQLRDLGVGIAMDDFGTGYSSLSYLRRFPFSKVKIDQSFIRGLGTDRNSAAIIKAITDLCKTLGMSSLAEGVETEDQFRQLQDGSCGEAQGFLFSAPRPAAEVAAMCRRLSQPEWVGGMA
jgi:diguanylate cyclase (GGDEF)-like protein